MSTDDYLPPHEVRSGLGQLGDAGGGISPLVTPMPVPNAMQGSPGLATAAASPPINAGQPDDPGQLALAMARLANELFSGTSVVPAPAPAQVMSGANTTAPGSPGIAPSMLPAAPVGAAPQLGDKSDERRTRSSTAVGTTEHDKSGGAGAAGAPSLLGAPNASSFPGSSPPVAPGGAALPSASAVPGASSLPGASALPASGALAPPYAPLAPTSASGVPGGTGGLTTGGAPSGGLSSAFADRGGAPSRTTSGAEAARSPGHGMSPAFAERPRAATPTDPSRRGGLGASTSPAHGEPGLASKSGGTVDSTRGGRLDPEAFGVPGGPFGPASFALPQFGDASLDGMTFPLADMPALASPTNVGRAAMRSIAEVDDAPYFVPAADAPTIERAPAIGDGLAAPRLEHGTPVRDLGGNAFDPYLVRKDFPILEERVHGGKRLVWLDNAATTQKPQAVIDRLAHFYAHENSNIHRAAHTLAARATDAYEQARETVRRFLNAPSAQEIIFVRGATEGINLVAQAWGRKNIGAGDEIVLTQLEHHANIVPWQMLCAQTGARLRVAPVDDRGDVILEAYDRLLGPRTKLVAFTQVSNALGTITPAREMIAMARRHGATIMLDGAQAVSHTRVDVQALDCDFYVFSGHKVFAPTGIGAVFGKRDVLANMPPWQGGGNMIADVTFEKTTYQPPPFRFEAGTGNIADAVGLGAALDYVMRIGIDVIDRYEHDLLTYATGRLAEVPGLTLIGTSATKAGVLSFVLDGQRTEDVGGALDKEGIAVRSGHHCAQPILRRFGLEASVRASLAFYNVCEDIDALVDALKRLQLRGSR